MASTDHEAQASYRPAITTISDCDYTIGDALRGAAARWPARRALVEGVATSDARTWTYTELLRDSETVARALLTRFHPGERVAVWSANSPQWVLLELGAALGGITLVTVNPAYRVAELEFVLRQSRAQGIFVQPQVGSRDLSAMAREVSESLPELRLVQSLGQWAEFVSLSTAMTARLPDVRPTDPAQIQYTSGTTGFPKGAVLPHRALAVNGRLYAETIGATPRDVWINPMPLFHTAGCGLVTLGALQTGGVHVLPGKFDADLMLDLFEHHRGTILLSVPTMLIRMLDAQRAAARDLSSWRLATLGGAPVPVELIRRAQRDFGVDVEIGYGQTEAAPYITHTAPGDTHSEWFETVGQPLPHVEVKIADQDTGETVDNACVPSSAGFPGIWPTSPTLSTPRRSGSSRLQWLGERNRTLASCGQIDADAWYAENTEHGRTCLRAFLNWVMQSRHCRRSLSIPAMKISRRAALSEDERLDALGRLLTDTEIPMRLRVAGVIVLLYAQPVSRIVRLSVDDVIRDGDTVLLRLGEPASPVPTPVASLLLEYIDNRDNMNTTTNAASRWLFPGRRAGQPARPDHLSVLLHEVGVPAAAARGAAIRQQFLELSAPVVANALGYHDKTTSRLLKETGGT